jgi:type I restriction enzyme R subunit
LKYSYLGNFEDRPENSNIEKSLLVRFLKDQHVSNVLIDKALYELERVAGDQNKSLYEINKEVYGLLRYGVKVKEDVGENTETVWLINWDQPLKNYFAIAEEVTVSGEHEKRPDIVLYVNGIALGVLELKRSVVSVSEGIRQNLDNQKKIFIQSFFTTMQFVMAGNDTEGLRYATIETPEKYYLKWNEEGAPASDLLALEPLSAVREGTLSTDPTTCSTSTKLLNQYFDQAAQERVHRREGGISAPGGSG